MRPSMDDVERMAVPLVSVSVGVQRAWRGRSGATALTVLQAAATRDNVRPSEIATALGVHQSSITRQVRALEESGHVTLAMDPEDRRSCFITLTDSGRAEVDRLTKVGLERFATFVADWDPADVRTLGRLLGKLEEAMAAANRQERRQGGRHWQQKD
ncbi:MarR family transcriptional regulator [Crossiella sp. SN42]|uniref:MarR family winged helix-turn-helix transcriptional regulator n=1 Tax=Crossiella sp. SN42 TaxID=2944808 RepID=UPI00207C4015|nr:MarR family transcriptional regulator [Crossiella sp. SN42]MCO1580356.1 MarR family transcriptional regulator [Crossiella sp. SN42]